MTAVYHQRFPVFSGIQKAFQLIISRVVSSHESHLNQVFSPCHFRFHDPLAGICLWSQRLLAHNKFSCLYCGGNILLMEFIDGSHHYGIHFIGCDHLFSIFKESAAIFFRHTLAKLHVHIGTGHYFCTLQRIINTINMRSADGACSHNTHS